MRLKLNQQKKSTKKSKKPANNDEMVESILEELEEAPRSSRKRKIPSYLKEFAVEDTKIAGEESEKAEGSIKEKDEEKVLLENGLADEELVSEPSKIKPLK